MTDSELLDKAEEHIKKELTLFLMNDEPEVVVRVFRYGASTPIVKTESPTLREALAAAIEELEKK